MNKLAYTLAALAFLMVGASMAQAAEPEPVLVVTTDSVDPAVNRQVELWAQIHLAEYLKTAGPGRVSITYLKTGKGIAKATADEIQSPAFMAQTSQTMGVAAQVLRESMIVRDAFAEPGKQ